jgi:hypothetical protein
MEPHRGILISRVPADGIGGLIFALGMVAIALMAVPQIRLLALVSLVGGVLLAPVLFRRRPLHRGVLPPAHS